MKNTRNHITTGLFATVAITMPWSIKLNSLSLLLLLCLLVITYFKERKQSTIELPIWLFILYYLLFISSVVRSSTLTDSLYLLEKNIPFLIFPIICALLPDKYLKQNASRALQLFSLSVVAIVIFLFVHNSIIFVLNPHANQAIWYYSNFTSAVSIHPVYLSMYCIFSFFFFAERTAKGERVLAYSAAMSFLLFTVIFLQGRTSTLALIVIIIVFFLVRAKKLKNTKSFLLVIVLNLIVAGTVFLLILPLRRIKFFLSAINTRLEEWKSAWNVFKSSPLLGVGAADVQYHLDLSYLESGFDIGIENRWNVHNQFLQILAEHGLIGFIILSLIFLFGVIRGFRFSPHLLILTILMGISSLTESTLQVQKGIVFFTFFYSVLIQAKSNDADL